MKRFGPALVAVTVLSFFGCGGPDGVDVTRTVVPDPSAQRVDLEMVLRWNRIAIDASGFDHSHLGAKEQAGPVRASRAVCITQIALHDALQGVEGRYETFLPQPAPPSGPIDENVAVAQAAHDALVSLFPSQKIALDAELAADLQAAGSNQAVTNGVTVGQRSAALILSDRVDDRSDLISQGIPYVFNQLPGFWRVDPINPGQTPLGANWSLVRPFVLDSSSQFRLPPPPDLTSPAYTQAFNEVKAVGGDGLVTPTIRTEDQTVAGIFWAYDGTPSLCAPPRLYNQIATQIGQAQGLTDGGDMARYLTLVNLAMADAGSASWDSKYFYNYWRPVNGIREADPGTGPSGLGDGNPETTGDPTYVPLCAPASNLQDANFTPPFPAYPSGHATFGGALFQVMRRQFGRDDIPFTFVSDEFNGITRDNLGNVRPLIPRSFASLSQAEEENGQSRIYLGIHWSFDKTGGITQGNQVANHVFDNVLRPR